MDYIVTCAEKFSWTELEPFVRSARANAPQARLVFFAGRLPPGTVARLREEGVELHPFDALFPEGTARTGWMRSLLWRGGRVLTRALRYREFCRRLRLRLGALLLPRNQGRFFMYRAWIEDCTQAGDRLLLCDARDIIFQSDPFAGLPRTGAFVGEEQADVPLRANAYNERWYRETYGAAELARHGERPVICAGVIGGERDAIGRILDAVVEESARRPHHYGADQAIINHLHYEGRLGAEKLLNGASLVWHLYGVPAASIRVTTDQTIETASGTRCPIIHMYDRHAATQEAVNRQWSAR